MAIAPTASISMFSGASPGIDPIAANTFSHKTLSGTLTIRNPALERLLAKKGKNTEEVWSSIALNEGSVAHLDCLDEYEMEVFRTAFEIDQRWIVDHAANRQRYVCQSQSVNLFLRGDTNKRDLEGIHRMAWARGLKSLYYCRSQSLKRAEKAYNASPENNKTEAPTMDYDNECLSCQ